jgi:hypothetical protein
LSNNSLDTDNTFDTVCAVRFALYTQTVPSPSGTALQVKLMLAGHRIAAQERKMKCIYCGAELTKKNISSEHIIQNAIGGLLESENICCDSCNTVVEEKIDKDFCSTLAFVTGRVPNLQKTNKSKSFPSYRGYAIYENEIFPVTIKCGKVINCNEYKKQYRKNLTKENYKHFYIIAYDTAIDSKALCNGLRKIALNYAIANNIDKQDLQKYFSVRLDNGKVEEISLCQKIIPFMPLNAFDVNIELSKILNLYHMLILFSYKKYLICYIDIYNTFQFYVVLSDEWTKGKIYESYIQNIEKITRDVPDTSCHSFKDLIILANQYGVKPIYDDVEFRKQIENKINKIPYRKNIYETITSKIDCRSFMHHSVDFMNKATSLCFYLDEDDDIRTDLFKIFTPVIQSNEMKLGFYPLEIQLYLQSHMLKLKQYNRLKVYRLNKYLNELQLTTAST